jgi:hypothetical protein
MDCRNRGTGQNIGAGRVRAAKGGTVKISGGRNIWRSGASALNDRKTRENPEPRDLSPAFFSHLSPFLLRQNPIFDNLGYL